MINGVENPTVAKGITNLGNQLNATFMRLAFGEINDRKISPID
jgi:hypothetical protein